MDFPHDEPVLRKVSHDVILVLSLYFFNEEVQNF